MLQGNFLVIVHTSKEHPIKIMNKNLAMHLNQHKIEQEHTFLLKLFSKGKAAVVHHARGCHMRCAGDSCRQSKRPEAAHGLHVSSMFYYLENRSSVPFATEDSTGNHVMCRVNRVRSKHHNCSRRVGC